MKGMLVCPITGETDAYIKFALHELKQVESVDTFDYRYFYYTSGSINYTNHMFTLHINNQPLDFILIVKGELIHPKTIKYLRKKYPDMVIALWHFDPIDWEQQWLIDRAKECTHFFTSCGVCVPEYKKLGINTFWLSEGCDLDFHKPFELMQDEKEYYGSDVSFAGTMFYDRAEILRYLLKQGFDLKIWGPTVVKIPIRLQPAHVKRLNNLYEHSKMVSAAKIHIGVTRTPDLKYSWSARLYRIMAAGGFYIQDDVPGLEDFFDIGKDLEVFKDKYDLSEKIHFYLDNEKERKKIAERGMRKVRSKHTFTIRMEELLNLCGF